MIRIGVLLLAAAFIAAMASCASAQGSLTVSSTEGGDVASPGEGTFAFGAGTVVDLVAVAEGGYHFVNWSGDVDTVAGVFAATTTVTMDADYSLIANFAQAFTLSLDPNIGVAIRGDIGERGYLFPSDVQDHNPFHE
jgi:hypothetical protein